MVGTEQNDPLVPAPIDPVPNDQSPIDQAPIDQAPIDQAPIDQVPLEPVPVDPATRRAQLAWAIGSAPLLNHALAPHAALTAAEAAQWWAGWQPASPPPAVPQQRLGSDFERLWQYWLTAHPDWQLLAHNLPIREQGRTLGEFDLIVQNRHSGEQEHWELAVKFYLGAGDLDQPASWHGPHFRDRLDRKLQHLRDEQLRWRERPAGQHVLLAAGLAPQRSRAVIKGRLCYPLAQRTGSAAFAAAAHERGVWATVTEWQAWLREQPEPVSVRMLARSEWLAVTPALPMQPFAEWLTPLRLAPGQRPLALLLQTPTQCWPLVFVVPDDWSQRARRAQQAPLSSAG